jgi:hypothetical protein
VVPVVEHLPSKYKAVLQERKRQRGREREGERGRKREKERKNKRKKERERKEVSLIKDIICRYGNVMKKSLTLCNLIYANFKERNTI